MGGQPAEFPNPAQPSQEPVSPFSIKDERLPNAFSCDDHARTQPMRWQFSAGYSFLWFRPANFPPLATTGSLFDAVPGAIGQPNTAILSSGQRDPGSSSAFQLNSVYWLVDPEVFSADANFFIMEQRSKVVGFDSGTSGIPLLARPFFNPGAAREDADPRALAGTTTGSLSDAITTRLMGAELNLKWYSGNPNLGSSVNLFLGGRWLRLDERYSSFDTTNDLAPGGFATTFSDNFTTYNQFFGAQVGCEWQFRWQRLTFGVLTKVAVGPNYQTIKVSGRTEQTDLTTGEVITDTQGLFAQTSNVGVYHAVKVAVLPEVALKLNFDLTDRIRFNVGYTLFLLNSTVRPGDQIDRRIVNIQPLLGNGFLPALPGPPSFQQSSFHAQMLNLGVEFLY